MNVRCGTGRSVSIRTQSGASIRCFNPSRLARLASIVGCGLCEPWRIQRRWGQWCLSDSAPSSRRILTCNAQQRRDDPVHASPNPLHARSDELGLIVDAEGVGDVDSAFICENHKLGVAYWCLPALYTHAVRLLRPLLAVRGPRCASTHVLHGMTGAGQLPDPPAEQVMLATGVATLINADNYTAWNARWGACHANSCGRCAIAHHVGGHHGRKRLLIAAALPLDRELAHLDLVFSKHPKSAEAWAHRRDGAAGACAPPL